MARLKNAKKKKKVGRENKNITKMANGYNSISRDVLSNLDLLTSNLLPM